MSDANATVGLVRCYKGRKIYVNYFPETRQMQKENNEEKHLASNKVLHSESLWDDRLKQSIWNVEILRRETDDDVIDVY